MAILIRLLVVAAAVYLLYRLARYVLNSGKPDFKCATCRHCQQLYADGVICRYGDKKTFKNPIHIENCTDFEHDPRIPLPRA